MFKPEPDFFHPGPGVKKHRIPDPDPQHWSQVIFIFAVRQAGKPEGENTPAKLKRAEYLGLVKSLNVQVFLYLYLG
jgi:hypothetical protein